MSPESWDFVRGEIIFVTDTLTLFIQKQRKPYKLITNQIITQQLLFVFPSTIAALIAASKTSLIPSPVFDEVSM